MTTWPNPDKPGVPLNPERDGWHWLCTPDGDDVPYEWRVAGECERGRWPSYWVNDDDGWKGEDCIYIAPCIPPAEITAREQAAAVAMRELCAKALEDMRDAHNKAMIGQWHTADTSRAYTAGSVALRGLPTPTDALDQMLAQARNDDPQWDGTDAAHPAWWRGNDRGVEAVVEIISGVLDGKTPGTYGSEALTKLAKRLAETMEGA